MKWKIYTYANSEFSLSFINRANFVVRFDPSNGLMWAGVAGLSFYTHDEKEVTEQFIEDFTYEHLCQQADRFMSERG